jgi:hypothetical protein
LRGDQLDRARRLVERHITEGETAETELTRPKGASVGPLVARGHAIVLHVQSACAWLGHLSLVTGGNALHVHRGRVKL